MVQVVTTKKKNTRGKKDRPSWQDNVATEPRERERETAANTNDKTKERKWISTDLFRTDEKPQKRPMCKRGRHTHTHSDAVHYKTVRNTGTTESVREHSLRIETVMQYDYGYIWMRKSANLSWCGTWKKANWQTEKSNRNYTFKRIQKESRRRNEMKEKKKTEWIVQKTVWSLENEIATYFQVRAHSDRLHTRARARQFTQSTSKLREKLIIIIISRKRESEAGNTQQHSPHYLLNLWLLNCQKRNDSQTMPLLSVIHRRQICAARV